MSHSSSSTTTAYPPLAGDSLPCAPPKKRRRTRRRRLQELPHLTPSCSSTSSSPRNCEKIDDDCDVEKTEEVMEEEEEEEDTYLAYCLMLLSRGPAPPTAAGSGSAGRRRRPREAEETGVYRCKTCNKTFSSFQALGGHRTSHTKPKLALAAPPALTLTIVSCPDGRTDTDITSIAAIPLEATKPRVHACSICGLEFASGQALGGHMRRHRPLSGSGSVSEKYVESEDDKAVMLLDLNAPPPPHFDQYQLPGESPPPAGLQFSALVGCHY